MALNRGQRRRRQSFPSQVLPQVGRQFLGQLLRGLLASRLRWRLSMLLGIGLGLISVIHGIFIGLGSPGLTQQADFVAQGRGGAVASVDRQATQVGIEVLRAGGNAVDIR